MKEIDFDLENNPFINFLSSRYTMSARVNVENLWIKSKEQDLSFFVMSLGALMIELKNGLKDNISRKYLSDFKEALDL